MELLTTSRLKEASDCLLRHHYRFELGYAQVGPTTEAIAFGSAGHLALETWLGACRAGKSFLEATEAALGAIPDGLDPWERIRLEELLLGYSSRWWSQDYEILFIEKEFCVPLVNPKTGRKSRKWKLAGKIDGVVRDKKDGLVKILEHKFHSVYSDDIAPGGAYYDKLRIDLQLSMYYLGLISTGITPDRAIYDVIGKPRLLPLKATPENQRKYTKAGELYSNQRATDETSEEFRLRLRNEISTNPAKYYQRAEIVRLEHEIKRDLQWIWERATIISMAGRAQCWPANDQACISKYGSRCSFFPVCNGDASIDDSYLFVKTDNKHPELSLVL